ncbi:MAG: autotransporter-associated beta strand repeat-containing protein, partial [Verrucomicrobiota bacterium]
MPTTTCWGSSTRSACTRALTAAEVQYLASEPAGLVVGPVFLETDFSKGQAVLGRTFAASLAGDVWDPNVAQGDVLAFAKLSGPDWLSVAAHGGLAGTPAESDSGTNVFSVRVTDSTARSAEATFRVVVTPANYWTNLAGGSWATAANWFLNSAASGGDQTADFSQLNLAAPATVTLDGARTIGGLLFADVDPDRDWTLAPGSGGALTLAVSQGVPTIEVSNRTATLSVVLAGTQGLVKSGGGTLYLTGNNTYSGDTVVEAGSLGLSQNFSSFGSSALRGKVVVNSGATLSLSNNPTGWGGGLTAVEVQGGTVTGNGGLGAFGVVYQLTGGTISGSARIDLGTYGSVDGAIRSLASPVTSFLSNSAGIQLRGDSGQTTYRVTTAAGTTPSGVDLQIQGNLSERTSACTLIKDGAGTLALAGSTSHTGPTIVTNGVLRIVGTLGSGTAVRVGPAGRLEGTGTVGGALAVLGTLAPGLDGRGTLTCNNTLTLEGVVQFALGKSGGSLTNNRVAGATGIVAGGTLHVSAAGEALAVGDTFTLFNTTPSGTFAATNLPVLPTGLAWRTPDNFRTLTVIPGDTDGDG